MLGNFLQTTVELENRFSNFKPALAHKNKYHTGHTMAENRQDSGRVQELFLQMKKLQVESGTMAKTSGDNSSTAELSEANLNH
jgi:hypothetical protein